MELLNPRFNPDNFFELLGRGSQPVLMLDYDGTLAPFRIEREQAMPYPGVRDVLRRLIVRARTRLVIITGRPVDNIIPLLGLEPPPEIWGSHGLERRLPDGRRIRVELDASARQGLKEAEVWLAQQGLDSVAERKPSGIAFHWRGKSDDEIESIQTRVSKKWACAEAEHGLILSEFDGGLELRVAGITKGDAVAAIIEETGSTAVAAYLGDDLTDEDAFNALEGRGPGVLVRESPRKTAADMWIQPPQELLWFLEKWLESGG